MTVGFCAMTTNISVILEPYGSDVTLKDSALCERKVLYQNEAEECVSGSIFALLTLILKISGLTPVYYRAEYFHPGYTEDVWNLVYNLMRDGKVDFSCAVWWEAVERVADFNFVQPPVSEREVEFVVIEQRSDKVGILDSLRFNNVFGVFSFEVWAALAVLLVVFSLWMCLWRRRGAGWKDFEWSALQLFRIGVNQSPEDWRGCENGSWMVLLWSFTAVVVISTFSGVVYMKTTVRPGWIQPFWDLKSMEDSGYK